MKSSEETTVYEFDGYVNDQMVFTPDTTYKYWKINQHHFGKKYLGISASSERIFLSGLFVTSNLFGYYLNKNVVFENNHFCNYNAIVHEYTLFKPYKTDKL